MLDFEFVCQLTYAKKTQNLEIANIDFAIWKIFHKDTLLPIV